MNKKVINFKKYASYGILVGIIVGLAALYYGFKAKAITENATKQTVSQANVDTQKNGQLNNAKLATISKNLKSNLGITADYDCTEFNGAGQGTETKPYLISNTDNLKCLSGLINTSDDYKDKFWSLTDNINLNGGSDNQWIPIGNQDHNFAGNFNGGGFYVSGLYIDNNTENQGLFGIANGATTITNLGISSTDSYLRFNNNNCGAVLGLYNEGEGGSLLIEKVYNTVNVNIASNYINFGGVIGSIDSESTALTIKNCYNTGNIQTFVQNAKHIGGVVGYSTGSIEACYNTGSIYSNVTDLSQDFAGVGGIVGEGSSGSTIFNCYNSGNITLPGMVHVGGIAGTGDVKVNNSYNLGSISVHGVVGGIKGSGGFVTNCVNLATVISSGPGDAHLHRIYGADWGDTASGSYSWNRTSKYGESDKYEPFTDVNDVKNGKNINANSIANASFWQNTVTFSDVDWNIVTGMPPTLKNMPLSASQNPFYFSAVEKNIDGNKSNDVTISDQPAIHYNYNVLNQEIDLDIFKITPTTSTTITYYAPENYDFNVLTINGVDFDTSNTINLSFPGAYTVSAMVGDSCLRNFTGSGTSASPFLISTASDLTCMAKLVDGGWSSAILEKNWQFSNNIDLSKTSFTPIGTLQNPFSGHINGAGYVIKNMNIVGSDNLGLFGCTNNITINNLGITNSSISGTNAVGSFIGRAIINGTNTDTLLINNSYSTANVSGSQYVGGFAGYITSNKNYFPDNEPLPNTNFVHIANSYHQGNVQATGTYNGGLIGAINNCPFQIDASYNSGAVYGTSSLGGLIGYVYGYYDGNLTDILLDYKWATINNAYNTANIYANGSGYSGGLIGNYFLDMYNTYYPSYQVPNVLTLKNSINNGSIISTTLNTAGGLVGQLNGYKNTINIDNSVSMPLQITGSNYAYDINRLIGYAYSYDSGGNTPIDSNSIGYGYSGTSRYNTNWTPFTADGGNGSNGLNASTTDLTNANFWKNTLGFNNDIWTIENNKLPVLKNVLNPSAQKLSFYVMANKKIFGNGTQDITLNIAPAVHYSQGGIGNNVDFFSITDSTTNPNIIYTNTTENFFNIIIDGVAQADSETISISTTADHIINANTTSCVSILTGQGSKTNPYKLLSVANLKCVAGEVNLGNSEAINKYWQLSNNIDLNGGDDNQWTPIGTSTNPFSGFFDGNGHVISNLYYNGSNNNSVGFIGSSYGDTAVANLGILNANVVNNSHSQGDYASVLIGSASGNADAKINISDVYLSGTLVTNGYAGAVSAGFISQNQDDLNVSINRIFSTVNIVGNYNTGGFIGRSFADLKLTNSVAAGVLTVGNFYYNRLIGTLGGGTSGIRNNYGNIDSSYKTDEFAQFNTEGSVYRNGNNASCTDFANPQFWDNLGFTNENGWSVSAGSLPSFINSSGNSAIFYCKIDKNFDGSYVDQVTSNKPPSIHFSKGGTNDNVDFFTATDQSITYTAPNGYRFMRASVNNVLIPKDTTITISNSLNSAKIFADVSNDYSVDFYVKTTQSTYYDEEIVSNAGGTVTPPANPSAYKWDFNYWCLNPDNPSKFDFNTTITGDTTLFAYMTYTPIKINSMSISNDSILGGDYLTVFGSAFNPDTKLFFDETAVNTTYQNSTTISAIIPEHIAGNINIVAKDTETNVSSNNYGFTYSPLKITTYFNGNGSITSPDATIDQDGNIIFNNPEDRSATLNINADPGWRVMDVFIDGVNMGSISTYKFNDVTQNHIMSVNFYAGNYSVSVIKQNDGGSVLPNKPAFFVEDSQANIIITADNTHQILSVTDNDVPLTITNNKVMYYTIEHIKDDHIIKVSFMVTPFTVSFNSNGGTPVSQQTVDAGNKIVKPANPTKQGYKFDNWYTNSNLTGTAYNFNSTVANNFTLYAKWIKNQAPTPAPMPIKVTKVYSPVAKSIYLKSKQSIKIPLEIKTNKPAKVTVKSSTKNVQVQTKSINAKNNKVINVKVKAIKVKKGTKKAKLTITAGSKKLKINISVKKSYKTVKKITVKWTKKLKKNKEYQIAVKTAKGLYKTPVFKLTKTAKKYIKIDKAGKVTAKKKTPKKGKNKYVSITVKQGSGKKVIKLRVV